MQEPPAPEHTAQEQPAESSSSSSPAESQTRRNRHESREHRRPRARKILSVIGVGVGAVLLAGCVSFAFWAQDTYPPIANDLEEVRGDPRIDLSSEGDIQIMRPAREANGEGLVFLAGAKVAPEAYLATFQETAATGVTVIITQSLFNLPILESRPLSEFTSLAPEVHRWSVGGHSLGGVKACDYAAENPEQISGLVLLGSYCVSDALAQREDLHVLSVSGSADLLSTPEKITASVSTVPKTATFLQIEGLSHAQFGAYGAQSGDGAPTLSEAEARAAVDAALNSFFSTL